jgi:ketosteroid isomerase-like protein
MGAPRRRSKGRDRSVTAEIESQALESYEKFVATRNEIDQGAKSWSALADFFTEDAAYIDPAWGRIETREGIREFFVTSMEGLTGHGWSTPENWTMARGHRLISQWDQILGEKEDGTPWLVPGLSILYYAGDGLFCYSHDMLNMTHIGQTMRAMGWKPPAQFNLPPRDPNRDVSLPKAWAHLAKG